MTVGFPETSTNYASQAHNIQHKRKAVVHYPQELEKSDFYGGLYGYYYPESNQYNIVAWGEPKNGLQEIGILVADTGNQDNPPQLLGVRTAKGLEFTAEGKKCQKKPYNLTHKIFSRNTGILETDAMLEKTVIIIGCGSVGSLISLELARAGVGKFVLIDSDIFEYHNICRHQCGVKDVGKFKAHALKERILDINPLAQIITCTTEIERIPQGIFDAHCQGESILVGAADSREADARANEIACLYDVPFISIGLWHRAYAGEIFYSLPGMPCYTCVFAEQIANSAQVAQNRVFYVDEEEKADTIFEPGLSVDIGFVTLIGVKLIIDLLNHNTSDYIPKVLNHLQQFTLVCNSNDPRLGGEEAEIFPHPLFISTSVQVNYQGSCPACRHLP
jgi:molybdopterin/thiamine biosynthesis adenylyltransferase